MESRSRRQWRLIEETRMWWNRDETIELGKGEEEEDGEKVEKKPPKKTPNQIGK